MTGLLIANLLFRGTRFSLFADPGVNFIFYIFDYSLFAYAAIEIGLKKGEEFDLMRSLTLKGSPGSEKIIDEDFPRLKEVDAKLVPLAKIITNDFNLHKVADLHGVEVLNVNQLTKTLKPVVLPGQTLQIMIMKEGKEPLQGIGYLDDGTPWWWIKLKKLRGGNGCRHHQCFTTHCRQNDFC